MTFSPQLFLSNIKAKDGLARPARFEVVLPIPTYINEFISQSIFEKLLNLPNTILTDAAAFANQALGRPGPKNEQSKTNYQ
jgi:hypothetical protein